MNKQQQELYEKLLKKVNEYCLGQAAEDVIAAIDALVESYETPKVDPTSKTSKALENIRKYCSIGNPFSDDIIERHKLLDTIETALKDAEKDKKALEIFKRNCLLSQYPDGTYELAFTSKIQPTEEDTEILKEVLK